MRPPRDFVSGFWRKLGFIAATMLVGFLLSLVSGKANAQTAPPQSSTCPNAGACTQQQAYQYCTAWGTYSAQVYGAGNAHTCTVDNPGTTSQKYHCLRTNASTGAAIAECLQYNYFPFGGCPAPTVWNEGLKQCMDPAECLDRNDDLGADRYKPRSSAKTEKCVAGCQFKMPTILETTTVNTQGGAVVIYRGVMQYTGLTCTANPPSVPEQSEEKTINPDPQECTPADGSLTKVCVKSTGEKCMTAPRTGFQLCWQPGETGEKTQDDVVQKRVPGPSEQPPVLTLPNGDTLTKHGESKTVTETTTNRTTTTTTTNYVTTNGTNAGTKNSGEKPDGTATTPGAPGSDGEGDAKTASGGQDCTEAGKPVVNGDPHLQMVALQAWATRCAVESKDAVTSTGDISDCATNFTLDGPPKSAELLKLRAIRHEICGEEKTLKDGDPNGGGDTSSGNGLDGDGDATFAVEGEEQGTEGLDDEGFGFPRSCPTMPTVDVFGTSVQFDNSVMCDWLALAGTFVLALAALVSLRILAGGGV